MSSSIDDPAAKDPLAKDPLSSGDPALDGVARLASGPAACLPWIPIRSLAPRHRDRILDHLLALPEHDRYLRFGYSASDAQIARYVESMDFGRDELFGVFNRKLRLIAMAHLACPPAVAPAVAPDAPTSRSAEFGVSVADHARGRGFGARLFEHAVLHARNRGFDQLFIHALSENKAMLHIARKAGAEVHRAGSESDAYLTLPAETWASQAEQLVGDGAAALDYQFKLQARFVDAVVGLIGGVKSNAGAAGSSAKD